MQKVDESIVRQIHLRDHLAASAWGGKRCVDAFVVTLEIDSQLMGVRPIELAVSRDVVLRVPAKRLRLLGVGK